MKLGILFTILLLVGSSFGQEPDPTPPVKANTRPSATPGPKPEPFDEATVEEMTKCVTFETAEGRIILEMFPVTAPITVRNFLNLTAIKAFDNTTFSRIVPGFVIQGGVLHTNKDISYELSVRALRPLQDEPNLVRHVRGIVSMARGDEPNSAGTSFFILVDEAPSLDNKFAAFGRVVGGMEVVDAINKMPVKDEAPKDPVVITKAEVTECGPEVKGTAASTQPPKLKKENELHLFGLRGQVKSVRETTRFDGKKSDEGFSDILTEFGTIGEHVRSTFFGQDGKKLFSVTREPALTTEGVRFTREVYTDASGSVTSVKEITSDAENSYLMKEFDPAGSLVRTGTLKTTPEGRAVEKVLEEPGKKGSKLTTRFTYDAYGFVTTSETTDGSGKRLQFFAYEYTNLDDRANWTERKIFDAPNAKKPIGKSTRTFEYYK